MNRLLVGISTLHRGAFCQFPFWWIYYYVSNKSTGKETGKMHLCALLQIVDVFAYFSVYFFKR